MTVKVFEPKSELLKKYISNFYITENSALELPVSFVSFPNYFNTWSIANNAKLVFENGMYKTRFCKGYFYSNLYITSSTPIQLYNSEDFLKISINFKPLGINGFIKEKLSAYYTGEPLIEFLPFPDFKQAMQTILKQKGDEEKIRQIEKYLILNYHEFKHPFLNEMVQDLMNVENDYKLVELVKKYSVSKKTITRAFNEHLCKTPILFKKIFRFRIALEEKNQSRPDEKLTTIGYDAHYFDQAHMIKDFKSITGYTPKEFFRKITPYASGKINFMYL